MNRRYFAKLAAMLPFTIPTLASAKATAPIDPSKYLHCPPINFSDFERHMRSHFWIICGKPGVGKSLLFDWLSFYKQCAPAFMGIADVGHINLDAQHGGIAKTSIARMRNPGMNQMITRSVDLLLDDLKVYGSLTGGHNVMVLPWDSLSTCQCLGPETHHICTTIPEITEKADWIIEVLGHGGYGDGHWPDSAWWACRTVSLGRFPGIETGKYGEERTWCPQKFIISTEKDFIRNTMLPVKAAQLLHVCRVCGGDTIGTLSSPLILNYGAEYAHEQCLKIAGIEPNKGVPVRMD